MLKGDKCKEFQRLIQSGRKFEFVRFDGDLFSCKPQIPDNIDITVIEWYCPREHGGNITNAICSREGTGMYNAECY